MIESPQHRKRELKTITRIVVSFGCFLTLMFAAGAAGHWWFQSRFMPVVFAEDAVQVLAYAACDIYRANPDATQDEIDRMIKFQHESSNINLRIDSNGKAVDPFGTAFRVAHHLEPGKLTTIVTSAGPDGDFATEDDISYRYEEERAQPASEGDG